MWYDGYSELEERESWDDNPDKIIIFYQVCFILLEKSFTLLLFSV